MLDMNTFLKELADAEQQDMDNQTKEKERKGNRENGHHGQTQERSQEEGGGRPRRLHPFSGSCIFLEPRSASLLSNTTASS
mmetsp:Transcript_8771/g.15330  ORF Transcript_8771/g.15330 Transcript_8771/m.15330 type:complete len:81 (+) Transcript_8771:52-294(+)